MFLMSFLSYEVNLQLTTELLLFIQNIFPFVIGFNTPGSLS